MLRQANGGPARARNAGIAQARADLILPLDADDLLDPACILHMVALLDQRKDLGIAYCDIRFFGDKNEVGACPEYDLNALLVENFMVVTSMFRKALWTSVGGYNEELLPDVLSGAIEPGRVFDLALPLSEAAEAYAAMDERRAVKVLLRP